jgi:Protein of unknown function (DUF3309)
MIEINQSRPLRYERTTLFALTPWTGKARREHLYLLQSGVLRGDFVPTHHPECRLWHFRGFVLKNRSGHKRSDIKWKCGISELAAILRQSEYSVLILLIVLILVFGFGGYRMGPGIGYYGGGGLSLVLTIVVILLLLKVI